MTHLTLSLCPDLAGLRRDGPGTEQSRYVLARIQADPRPPRMAERPRLDLALVIDRSGSMSGRRASRLAMDPSGQCQPDIS